MIGSNTIARLYKVLSNNLLFYFIFYACNKYCIAHTRHSHIGQITSFHRRIAATSTKISRKVAPIYGRCELDSHADTIVAGSNCVVLNYTGNVCDVSPYRDDYSPVSNVPVVTAATAWQSPHTGETYILVFNEALWMGDSMNCTLINPNQLRHFGTKVQDNPVSDLPLFIMTENNEFSMELDMSGTIIYADTH